jgi:hypothetical protein
LELGDAKLAGTVKGRRKTSGRSGGWFMDIENPFQALKHNKTSTSHHHTELPRPQTKMLLAISKITISGSACPEPVATIKSPVRAAPANALSTLNFWRPKCCDERKLIFRLTWKKSKPI